VLLPGNWFFARARKREGGEAMGKENL